MSEERASTSIQSVHPPVPVVVPAPLESAGLLQAIGRSARWSWNRAVLVALAIVGFKLVGFVLSWDNDYDLSHSVQFALKFLLVLLLVLFPFRLLWTISRSGGQDKFFPATVARHFRTLFLRNLLVGAGGTGAILLGGSVVRWMGGILDTALVPLALAWGFGLFLVGCSLGVVWGGIRVGWREDRRAHRGTYLKVPLWALGLAALLTLYFYSVLVVGWLLERVDHIDLFPGALVAFGIIFLALVPCRLVFLSRPLQDSVFTGFGFTATFFGLGMLVLFLGNLGYEVAQWFHYTPGLVAEQNERTLAARVALQDVEKILQGKAEKTLAIMRLERDVLTDAKEKQDLENAYRDKVFVLPLAPDGNIAVVDGAVEVQITYLPFPTETRNGEKAKGITVQEKVVFDGGAIQDPLLGPVAFINGKEVKNGSGAVVRDAKGVVYRFEEDQPVKDKEGRPVPDKNAKKAEVFVAGALSSELQNERITIREQKKVADMPLRDTSTWGVFRDFLTSGPASEAHNAGIFTALLGSLWVAGITVLFAVPVGVGAALYLEEYRTAGWLGNLIQININNLAGVPSVVYGILGGWVFVTIFSAIENNQSQLVQALAEESAATLSLWDRICLLLPAVSSRNVLGGGLTLGLLTLPVVIVSAQEAIRAVPSSIRHGAYALGATQWQTIWHNVLPMARPGILTGTILSLSRAIGEAAPLVLFGALLFVDQNPGPFTRFTVLPMQVFSWAERPAEGGIEIWRYNAAMAILVLLVVLMAMNAIAIILRNRAQKRMRY